MAATGATVVTQRSETNQMVVVEVLLVVLVLLVLVVVVVVLVVMGAVLEGCLTRNVTQSLSSCRGCIVFWPLRGRCRRRIVRALAVNHRSGVAATKLPNDDVQYVSMCRCALNWNAERCSLSVSTSMSSCDSRSRRS